MWNILKSVTSRIIMPFNRHILSRRGKHGNAGGNKGSKKQRNKSVSKPLVVEPEFPYITSEHGPLYSITSLMSECTRQLHGTLNLDQMRTFRQNFILNFVKETPLVVTDSTSNATDITDIADIPDTADTTNIAVTANVISTAIETVKSTASFPLYKMKSDNFVTHIGLSEENALKYLKIFVEKHQKKLATFPEPDAIIKGLSQESVRWRAAKKMFIQDVETLQDSIVQADKKARLRADYDDALQFLGSEDCPVTRFVAIDIEAYENRQKALTEIGIATFDRSMAWLEAHHIIIKEHSRLRNRKFAPDAKDEFGYGDSVKMSTDEAFGFIRQCLSDPGTALVGHSLNCDVNFMLRAEVHSKSSKFKPEFFENYKKYDLQHLFRCRRASQRHSKLEDICEVMKLEREMMHNAGNDAVATMDAFLKLMKIGQYKNISLDGELDATL